MPSKPRSLREEQARLSRAMRRDGCSWREIADEFARRWGISHLQAARLAHGISQDEAARRYNARWRPERPITGKHISYWEMWPARTGHEPPLDKLGNLAAVYECSVSDLLADVGDHRHLDIAFQARDSLTEIGAGSLNANPLATFTARLEQVGGNFDSAPDSWQAEYRALIHELRNWALKMRRRDLLSIIGAAASAAYAAPFWNIVGNDDIERMGRVASEPRRIDDATVGHIEAMLHHAMREEDAIGPQSVLETVLSQHRLVQALLMEETAGTPQLRLLSLFSNMSRFIGWTLFNLNDFDGAERYYSLARSAAHQADNDVLSGFVLCNLSHLATWRGDPRLGVEHALGALGWATRSESKLLSAYANDVGARAYASLIGRSDSGASAKEVAICRSALDSARQNLSSVTADDPGTSLLYFYGIGQFLATETQCLLDFGDARHAASVASDSLNAIQPQFTRNLAFARISLARARFKGGELPQARLELRNAAELATCNMSLRLRGSIVSARSALGSGGGKEMAELDAFLREHDLQGSAT